MGFKLQAISRQVESLMNQHPRSRATQNLLTLNKKIVTGFTSVAPAHEMSSRRKFILDCSAFMAVLAVTPISSFSRPATSDGGFQSLEQMSYPVLAGQVNSTFRVCIAPRQVVELKLLKAPLAPSTPVRPGRPLPGDAGHEKFSLIFSGPKHTPLPSAIHRFEHEQLGRFDMYVGQIGIQHTGRVRYEAGFNRPAPSGTHTQKLT
jgi:hypothetical protein